MEKEDFLRLLPKLVVEDNEVKRAILTALSGIMATKYDIERVIEHSDNRFERMLNERMNNLNANFSRIENIINTEFKTLDGKIESLSEGQDIIKEQIKEKKMVSKKE